MGFEDDNHTIADMSGVDRPSMAEMWLGGKTADKLNSREKRPPVTLDRKERRAAVLGALGAALLIGSVFLTAFGIVIFLMVTIW